jgi:hypothetical protein
VVPLSGVTKVIASVLLAVVVIVGVVADGHLTLAGQVTVRLPVASCFKNNVMLVAVFAVAGTFENENVTFPVKVMKNDVPKEQSIA